MENDYTVISTTLRRVIVAIDYQAATRKMIETYTDVAKSFVGNSWTIEVSPPMHDDKFCVITVLIHVNYGNDIRTESNKR